MATSDSLSGIDLSDYALETIGDDGAFVLYRGLRTATSRHPASILVVTHKVEHPRLESLKMLEHEHALRFDLDAAWAARPLALVRLQCRTYLVLDDPGGELLGGRLGTQPMELGLFLRLGVGLAAALGALHHRGIIHKDLTPDHVMIDEPTGRVWLTGFRIASRLPRERQTPEPPEVIAGTLPYMAPEQTGRMNRSIDSRSDLYALGVTLYQMLTGKLPFTASDPMEWVHCHVARQPIPPAECLTDVPPTVSAIVMRLLAKTAEERYQTAAGLERDLGRCLTQWTAERRIGDFSLGKHDVPDRLLIPERLYGREREIGVLLAAVDRVVTTGTPELVLVSGYSGIGKTSVVNELHKALVPTRALFASGKFDEYKRGIPYATLAQALQSLVRRLLVTSDAEMAVWRTAVGEALGPNGQLMINLVPELKLIIGEQPPLPDLPPGEAQRRFQQLVQRFIRVFARPEHPLALFFDDLQWLDPATLDLLEELLTQSGVQNLFVIGAYRDNEVDSAHPLVRKLQTIRESGAVLHEIALSPLTRKDLTQLVADALHAEPQRVAKLARLVGDKTAGNPFFTTQFLTGLEDEGLLRFDPAHARWSWDLDGIRARRYTDNVADLMFGKLGRLPAATQQALQSLACLGDSAEVTTLALVLGTSAERVHADLWEAVRFELVELVGGSYRFLHDRVQEAAYGLVPESQRAREHLRIGRLLAAHTPPEKREQAIFEIVNHLNHGAPLIASQDERERLSQLNLVAGKRAKASAAYAVALRYFASGAALLPENAWESCPQLSFALELHRAECEFLCGDLVSAEERLSILAAHAKHLADGASVACLRIPLYTVLRRPDRAAEIGLSYLTHFGIAWSPHPTDQEVGEAHELLWRELGSRPIETLLDLPAMSDPRIRAMIEVLSELLGPASLTDPNLHRLVLLRMAILSIQHGNTHASAVAYAYLNAVVGARFGRYAAGYRFGLLGMDLVDKKGLDRAKTRVYKNMAAWVVPWVRPLREARALLLRALEDVENWRPLPYYIMWVYTALLTHRLASGDPLLEAQREAEEGRRRLAQRARVRLPLDFMTGQLGLIQTLRGLTPVFGSFGSEELDEHDLEQHLQNDPGPHAACWYWIRKLQAHVYSAEHDRAVAMATKAERFLWTASADFLEAEYHLYGALARAAAADSAVPDQRRELLADVAAHHRRLLEWAANCPENFESRAALVGAEIARHDGRELDAERLYEQAIRSARVNGFLCIEALANEMAGRFYGARGFETSASAHLREARYCYLRWGAEGKVRQLDELYPHLGQENRPPDARPTISESLAQLELATVLKALQAVSGEIVLERLVDRLMRMVIEHAGAERGVLLLTGGGGLLMQAEATISAGAIGVRVCETPVSADDLAETVVRYVARTQETVILDDTSASNPFSSDRYIYRTRARSILCLPLVKQGRLIALLYLENHLAPGVFAPARVAVLEVLAPQAAMSLENSRLYRELERRESKIRRLVDTNIMGVAITRVDGAIIDANDAALEIVGYTCDDVRSGRVGWRELTPPEWQEASDRAVAQLQATGSFDPFEKELLRRDGTRVPVLLAGAAVDDTRQESVVFVIDLTERKRAEAELRRARASLARHQRASMLGEMAAAIAHDIRQPIAAAMIDATACLRALADNRVDLQQARRAASRMVKEATWADEIIHRTTALYKQATTRRERVDVNAVIREMTVLLQQEAGALSISVRTELAESIPDVRADRVQLQQVFMNLMLNAIEAMKDKGGELTIRSQANQEGGLLISVSDTGVGLPTENADEIFDAFVTTKPQGTGMGLAITRSIVESHGGRLWATANAGPGATLLFTLPSEMDGDLAR